MSQEPILEIPEHIAALPEEEQGPALVEAIHARKNRGLWAPPEEMRAAIPRFLLEAAQLIADAYGSVRVVRNLEGIMIDCPKNPGIQPIVYRYGQDLEKGKGYDPDEAISIPHPQLLRLMGEKVLRAAGEPAERDA